MKEPKEEPRARGTGSLIKINGCRFWYLQYWNNGKQVRESSRTESKMKAERQLQRRLGEKAIGLLPATEVAKLRYEDLRGSFMLSYRLNGRRSLSRKKNGDTYLSSLTHLDKFFANRRVSTITADEIRTFVLARQAAKASNGTINRSLAALKRMFKLAIQDRKLQAEPHIEMLKEPPARRGFLELGDFQKLRQHLPERLRPVVTLGFYSGMRLGEIRNLMWEQVNLSDHTIRLREGETKNDEPRIVPLNSETVLVLKSQRKKTDSDYVFGNGKPLGSFRKAWRTACVKAKLASITKREDGTEIYDGLIFHDLRRTGVRNLVRAGVSEQVAMAVSGHKTRSVFGRYNITSEADLKDAARKLDSYMAEKQSELDALSENTVKIAVAS